MHQDTEERYKYLVGRLDDRLMTKTEAEELNRLSRQIADDPHEDPSIAIRAVLVRAAVVWRFRLTEK